MSTFNQHGHFTLEVRGTVLLVHAYGPWNTEAAEYLSKSLKDTVNQRLSDTTWAFIAVIHNQWVYTAESAPIIADLHLWRIAHGMKHLAIILAEDSNANILTQYQFDSFYKQKPQECTVQYFHKLEDALHWIEENGYRFAD